MTSVLPHPTVLIRLDRLGDLILTLPVDQLPKFKFQQVQWVIPQGLEFVLDSTKPKRAYRSINKNGGWSQFWNFVKWLKQENFQTAIVFHGPWWVGLALKLAGIEQRHTRQSQWHSYLFYNSGYRQKRSQAELHELEYNIELALSTEPRFLEEHRSGNRKTLTEYVENSIQSTKMIDHTSSPNYPDIPFDLQKFGLKLESSIDLPEDIKNQISTPYIVIHAGMGGSAKNWPISKYAETVDQMSSKITVVLTGTKGDLPYLDPLKSLIKNKDKIVWLNEKLDGNQLIKVVSQAKAVLAPSTGVLHIAASCQVPTLGLFNNKTVERETRWGGIGSKVININGDKYNSADSGSTKDDENAIENIPVDVVVQQLTEMSQI